MEQKNKEIKEILLKPSKDYLVESYIDNHGRIFRITVLEETKMCFLIREYPIDYNPKKFIEFYIYKNVISSHYKIIEELQEDSILKEPINENKMVDVVSTDGIPIWEFIIETMGNFPQLHLNKIICDIELLSNEWEQIFDTNKAEIFRLLESGFNEISFMIYISPTNLERHNLIKFVKRTDDIVVDKVLEYSDEFTTLFKKAINYQETFKKL